MGVKTTFALCASLVALGAAEVPAQPLQLVRLYQGRRAPDDTDRLSRKVRVGRDGRVSISNVSGEIVVSASSGDEVSIDAIKRGSRSDFDRVRVVIDDRPGRVDIRTDYGSQWNGSTNVSVDYNVSVPADASLDLHSVSGRIRVDGVRGTIRLGTVSGSITSANTPKVEYSRTVSGEIALGGVSQDGTLSVSSVSGSIALNGVKARTLDLNSVSGEIRLRDAVVEGLTARLLSGSFEYSGTLARTGRYDVNAHSGGVRFALADNPGFELSAVSFSGSIRSDFQMTIGGDRSPTVGRGRGRGRRGPGDSLQATYGDGSASLNLRTFSGGIVITRR
jgi:DUF4097 and DUF4098 domain-containing protein YvlB